MLGVIIPFMLKYRHVILWVLAAVSLLGAGYYLKSIMAENQSLKTDLQLLTDQVEEAQYSAQVCDKEKSIAEGQSSGYQKQIRTLNTQLRNANSVQSRANCVPVSTASKADGYNGATHSGNELSGGNGLTVEYLIDFAGRAEEARLKALGCQGFTKQLWNERGYND